MLETRIREVKLSCTRCGKTFLEIKNCLIPIHFQSIFVICSGCSYVIKDKNNFQSESLEPEDQSMLKKEFYNAEKYT